MYRFLVNLCLVGLHIMGSNLVGASPVVDGEVLVDSSRLLHFDMPASCRGKNFCFDKGDKYPQEKIDKLLNTMPLLPFGDRIATGLTFRDGHDNPDCPANKTFIDKPIYYIRDENNKVRAVVQSPKFEQIYSTKWCIRPGQITVDTPHFLKGSTTLQQYKVECVNTYMDFEFLVLSDKYYNLKLKLVKPKGGIPVCCRCRYSKKGGD